MLSGICEVFAKPAYLVAVATAAGTKLPLTF